MSQVVHQVGAYPGFCIMKQLGVCLLPPEWDASQLQGSPSIKSAGTHLYAWVERNTAQELKSVLSKNTAQCPQSGHYPRLFAPEFSA